MTKHMKRLARAVLYRMGFKIGRINKKSGCKSGSMIEPDSLCEGFHSYYAAAEKSGVDVNDWIENELHWEPALPTLNEVVFPFLSATSCVCEIGPGTGRHARHIASRIQRGSLHLFDHSRWIQEFLNKYFAAQANVIMHSCKSTTLDMPDQSVDLIFSNGTFIELKLGVIYLLAKQFARVCKPHGKIVFDYIDISTPAGWQHLESQSQKYGGCFTYHYGHTIDKLFANEGFELTKRHQIGKSTYAVFTKKCQRMSRSPAPHSSPAAGSESGEA